MCSRCESYAGQVAGRTNDPDVLAWAARAARLRYDDNVAAGIIAETCPDCYGVVEGSAPGTQQARDASGKFAGSRYRACKCGSRVYTDDLVARHGLTGAFPRGIVAATGKAVD